MEQCIVYSCACITFVISPTRQVQVGLVTKLKQAHNMQDFLNISQ